MQQRDKEGTQFSSITSITRTSLSPSSILLFYLLFKIIYIGNKKQQRKDTLALA